MGERLCKTRKYLGTPKLTPMQLLWVVGAIFVFIFMETEIFSSFSDMTKTLLYTMGMVVCVLLGVSFVNVKKIAKDLKAIYVDKNMTPLEKVNAFGNVALAVLSRLGEAWELLNVEQFPEEPKETKPIEKLDTLE